MRKNQQGFTMLQMTITIVMLVLIAAFAIYNARDTVVETKITKVYNEIIEVKRAVIGVETLNVQEIENIGTKLENLDAYPQLSSYLGSGDHEYYLLNFKESKEKLEDALELRNIENNYIVDVADTEKIKIFLVNGVEVGDSFYYTDSEILEKYNEVFVGRK